MRTDVFAYLSGPITAKNGYTVEGNVSEALRVWLEFIVLGVPMFCPQLSGAFPSALEVPYETWMAYDFAVIDRCSHMVMLPRWESSAGAVRERKYAKDRGIPVLPYFDALKLWG